ncbi:MAG: leucyl aminopeptidase family protein [Gammaproteobacteria bacterium]|nr:leucyl aminopeptidase family protein [Gammaproteobacteria bacterium]MDH5323070.1 leucyl aminopeptidase family protein [Gammaproteobacteria bacterium]
MHELLPKAAKIRITQKPGRLTAKALHPLDQLLLFLPKRPKDEMWRAIPEGKRIRSAMAKRAGNDVPVLHTRLSNQRQTQVLGATVAADTSTFELLTIARKLIAAAGDEKAATLGICVAGLPGAQQQAIGKAAIAAALAAGFSLPSYKSTPSPARLRRIQLLGLDEQLDVDRIVAEAHGNNLARWLTVLPPNKLNADNYAAILKDLATSNGWQYKRYSTRDLAKAGAGAFLAVAQGNDNDSASIVRLRFRPNSKSATPDLSLVGKGIIFDTGGTNLKPFASMLDMHGDMQGSAIALGTLLAISELNLPLAVDCWLAITENRTGPNAYKSQDVVTAANGKTIQTIHTDAEGRMVLADTLTFASRERPQLMIDYATLTGSAVNAISTRYSAVFTNRAGWHPRLKRTGERSGERVWPFPIGKEFLEDLKSDVADIMQCSPTPHGDHILAGSFLGEFVEHDTPWVHVDLSSSSHKGGLGHIPSEITGFGIRYTMSLLLDERILQDH